MSKVGKPIPNVSKIESKTASQSQGTTVLVGSLASITEPVVAFVRLASGIIMPSALEVPVPVRLAAFLKMVSNPIPSSLTSP